jgi:hypothetical protein
VLTLAKLVLLCLILKLQRFESVHDYILRLPLPILRNKRHSLRQQKTRHLKACESVVDVRAPLHQPKTNPLEIADNSIDGRA